MFDRQYFYILISAILFKNSYQQLSFADFHEERVEPTRCNANRNGKSYCINCVTSRFCYDGREIDTPCSGSKPVCGLDTSSPPKYACVASNADCECPGTPELSYMQDPFNSHFYATCYGTDRITVDCDKAYYNPEMNDCSGTEAAPLLCPQAGTFEDDDPTTCDGFVLCSSSGDVVTSGKCTPPKSYFNPIINNCDFPIPPFRCQPGYIGYYGDPFDCQRYYVCNGDALIEAECCEAGFFDITQTPQPCSTSASPPPPPCTAALPCASDSATISTEMSTLAPTNPLISTSDSTSSSGSTEPSVSVSSSSSAATTGPDPSCIPLSNYTCPQPDGYFPQCNYCARTYFQCISGTATLRTCTGNGVFNTVPSYPACLSPEYCPYYP